MGGRGGGGGGGRWSGGAAVSPRKYPPLHPEEVVAVGTELSSFKKGNRPNTRGGALCPDDSSVVPFYYHRAPHHPGGHYSRGASPSLQGAEEIFTMTNETLEKHTDLNCAGAELRRCCTMEISSAPRGGPRATSLDRKEAGGAGEGGGRVM